MICPRSEQVFLIEFYICDGNYHISGGASLVDSGGVSLHMQEGKVRAVPFKIVGGAGMFIFKSKGGGGWHHDCGLGANKIFGRFALELMIFTKNVLTSPADTSLNIHPKTII